MAETATVPYHIIIDAFGVFYGPLGTAPFSRDWQKFNGDVAEFISICSLDTFAMSPDDVWMVTARPLTHTPRDYSR